MLLLRPLVLCVSHLPIWWSRGLSTFPTLFFVLFSLLCLFLFIVLECVTKISERVDQIQDAGLAERARALPDLLMSAWAHSTNEKSGRAWQKWLQWCSSFSEVCPRPADPFHVALYFKAYQEVLARESMLYGVFSVFEKNAKGMRREFCLLYTSPSPRDS